MRKIRTKRLSTREQEDKRVKGKWIWNDSIRVMAPTSP